MNSLTHSKPVNTLHNKRGVEKRTPYEEGVISGQTHIARVWFELLKRGDSALNTIEAFSKYLKKAADE
jgi:hypothetical protein